MPRLLIDWAALSERFGGRQAFIDKLIATVLGSHGDTPAKLRQAAAGQDLAALAFIAHSLKGLGGSLEAQGLRALAKETEAAARAGREEAFKFAGDLADMQESLLAELAGHNERERSV